MILVDTSVLSLAFRRRRRDLNNDEKRLVYALEGLFNLGDAAIIGPIRQEILSGIISSKTFDALRLRLLSLQDLALHSATFDLAASFYNTCRSNGIVPETVDMTICAATSLHRVSVFTVDPDFDRYVTCLPISLHKP